MNLGQLSDENEKFISRYKELGYKTRTQLANEAFNLLRNHMKKTQRATWREVAFAELQGSKPDIAFAAIEGEDFEG